MARRSREASEYVRRNWLKLCLAATLGLAVLLLLTGLVLRTATQEIARVDPTPFSLNESAPAHYLLLGQLKGGWEIQGRTDLLFSPRENGSFCFPYLVSRANYQDLQARGELYDCARVSMLACSGNCVVPLRHEIKAETPRDDVYYLAIFGPPGNYSFEGTVLEHHKRAAGNRLIEVAALVLIPTALGGVYSWKFEPRRPRK